MKPGDKIYYLSPVSGREQEETIVRETKLFWITANDRKVRKADMKAPEERGTQYYAK